MRLPFGLREVEEFEREVGDPRIAQVDDGLLSQLRDCALATHLSCSLYNNAEYGIQVGWALPKERLGGAHTQTLFTFVAMCLCAVWQNCKSSNTDIYVVFNSLK